MRKDVTQNRFRRTLAVAVALWLGGAGCAFGCAPSSAKADDPAKSSAHQCCHAAAHASQRMTQVTAAAESVRSVSDAPYCCPLAGQSADRARKSRVNPADDAAARGANFLPNLPAAIDGKMSYRPYLINGRETHQSNRTLLI
jgi:hypothetical protein